MVMFPFTIKAQCKLWKPILGLCSDHLSARTWFTSMLNKVVKESGGFIYG